MRIKIWGTRGSIPTPICPEEVRDKIISAILNIPNVENDTLRNNLINAVSNDSQNSVTSEKERHQIVETYLDNLSPLAGKTAGGNTPCIEVRSDDELFIIDAGSGIRDLGLELMNGPCGQGEGVIHLFFSHPHWDHIQGFPFFRPAFVPGNKIYIYGVHDIEAALLRQQEAISFPVPLDYMQADLTFIKLDPEDVLEFNDLRIRTIRNHHPGDAYSYRFEKGRKVFVYASDAAYPSGIDPQPYLDFFTDADILIFDAQFAQREADEKEDWGHSSSLVGVEMAQMAQVETLVLYHYDPTSTDKDLEKILTDTLKFQSHQYPSQKPVKIIIAQEGQVFDLVPSESAQLKQVPGGNVAILKPVGIFDEQVVNELRVQLEDLKQDDGSSQLIIDMSDVELLQISGLRALVRLRNELAGSHLALAEPSINVQQLIGLAGYIEFFAVYPSVHAALNDLQARETLNMPGQTLKNRYYIESKIGEGILGTVFKAKDSRLNQSVAIKILSASFSEEAIEKFLEQGRQIIELEHPNIVNIYECDAEHGLSFMVEELVESKLLRDLIDEAEGKPIPFDVALNISHDIALGLEYAHSNGVIHGDLKPKNVLLAEHVKISDFGLGRLESGKSLLNLDVPLALVSAHYLAPEQILGHPIDARTDLYALGVIMYELFTGRHPFEGTDQEVLEHHRHSQPRPLQDFSSHMCWSLEHLVLKLLDKDPNKRYATARRVRRILESLTPALSISSAAGTQNLAHFSRPALVGRDKQLQQLIKLWHKTESGSGQLVFITGEAGVGKTRLTQELAQQTGKAIRLAGVCLPSYNQPAYQPFIDALEIYLVSAPADDLVRQVFIEMERWIPDIYEMVRQDNNLPAANNNTLPPPPSLAKAMAHATQKCPWLLILDDLHLADPESLQLLHYLARHCSQMNLMIVGTYNTLGNEAENKYLTRLLDNLQDNVDYTTLTLKSLPQGKVKELLENASRQTIPADLVLAVFRRTQGNPLYINETVLSLVDNKRTVTQRNGKWRLNSVVEGDLPQDLDEAILRRFNFLNKETQTLLYQAAILGQTFNFSDLHEMSDLSAWDALENLEIALERQFLGVVPGQGVLRFKHIEIQRALYQNMGNLKRCLMHREAGEAQERCYPETEPQSTMLANHFWQAEVWDKAMIYSQQAARKNETIYASNAALFWTNRALAIAENLVSNEETAQQKFKLLLARVQIYSRLGQRKAQAEDLAALQNLAQDDAQHAAVYNRLAAYERTSSHLDKATAHAQAAEAAAQQANAPVLKGESLIQLAYIELGRGDFEAAREHMQQAQHIADSTNQQAEARALNGLATVYMRLHDYAQAEDEYQQALSMNKDMGRWSGVAVSQTNLAILYLQIGDYADAQALLQQTLEINRLISHRRGEAICLYHLGLVYKVLGVYNMAQSHFQESRAIHQSIEDTQGEAENLRALGMLELDKKDFAAARDYIGQALEMFQSLKFGAFEGNTWLVLGQALEGLEDNVKANHAYQQAQLLHQEINNEAGVIEARAGVARCLLAVDDIDAAKTEINNCLTWVEPHGGLGLNDPVQLYLTAYKILTAANDSDAANAALQTGQSLVQNRAEKILDLGLRASYLENVPSNKALMAQ